MEEGPAPMAVELDSVRLRLGGTHVLRDLSFQVRAGETFVLVGRSGAGKSTVLRLVNRLLVPDGGEVRVGGHPTTAWDPIELRRGVGYVIQEVGLFPHRDVASNVALVPRLLGWEPARIRERVDALLGLVGLPPETFRDRYPRELSGGQRQRVGVARALAADPGLLLCDEPFGALDPVTRAQLQREFRALSRRLEKTLLFVTHDLREALFLGDRIGLLHGGGLGFVGTPEAFLEAGDERVRDLREAASLPAVTG